MTDTPTPYPAPTPAHLPDAVGRLSPVVLITVVCALTLVAAGLLVAVLFAPNGHDTTVVTAFIVTVLGPVILGIVNLVRNDHTAQIARVNSAKLSATAAVVQQVAKDVNGHLSAHDQLAVKLTDAAGALAALAGGTAPPPRDATQRTRSSDVSPPAAPPDVPADVTLPPLSDQS